MAIFDAMIALVSIFGPLGLLKEQESGHISMLCRIQAVVLNFAMFASNLWSLFFGIHLIRLTNVGADAYKINTPKTYWLYLLTTLGISGVMTMLMTIPDSQYFSIGYQTFYLAGVNTDFWCWIDNSALLDNNKYKMLFYPLVVCQFILLFVFIYMRKQLNRLQQVFIPLDQQTKRSNRRIFLHAVAGSFCAYLAAPFVAYAPANFNWLCTDFNWETMDHVPTWFILSGLLLGVLHWVMFTLLIDLVRYSWAETCRCCGNRENRKKSLVESELFFMQLL